MNYHRLHREILRLKMGDGSPAIIQQLQQEVDQIKEEMDVSQNKKD